MPPRFVGRRLTLKADSTSVTIYDRVHEIVSYPRCWRRGQTFGADRFEAELAELRPAAKRSRAQQRLFAVLENLCSQVMLEAYLRDMANTDRALSRQLTEILDLVRQYGPEPVAASIEKASAARYWDSDAAGSLWCSTIKSEIPTLQNQTHPDMRLVSKSAQALGTSRSNCLLHFPR